MDFIKGFPQSMDRDVIFVVVDRMSKYAHFMTLTHTYTALVVAQTYLDYVFKLHGMPNSIVNNKDAVYMTLFWQESYSNIFRIFRTSNNLQKFKQCKKIC